jgi:hypothetical protein
MNVHIDINQAFTDLHEQHRSGRISREEYDRKLRTILIEADKLVPRVPKPVGLMPTVETEHSGPLTYEWKIDGRLSISVNAPLGDQHRLNAFPRHVRQAARLELDANMTDREASKLRVARAAGDLFYEAVMDDLLSTRAEEMLQRQGPDTRRAVNLDERFHLGDNPDVIRGEELPALIHGAGRNDDDRER